MMIIGGIFRPISYEERREGEGEGVRKKLLGVIKGKYNIIFSLV